MSSSFNFGQSSQSASLPSLTPLPQMTNSSNAFNFGGVQQSSLFGTPSLSLQSATSNQSILPLTSMPTLTLTTTQTPTSLTAQQTTNVFHGLGGVQTVNSDGSLDASSVTTKSNKHSTYLPPEIVALVESFKQFIKHQKLIREENSQQRFSIQPILEVDNELEDTLKNSLNKMEIEIQRNCKLIESLKRDTNKLLSNAEMAYRISRIDLPQTPSSYTIAQNKYINANTHLYFMEMVDNFEKQMNQYSKQIKELQTHVDNVNKPYNSEELFHIMRKQHETLICLAAQVYAVHEEVNKLKQKSTIAPKLAQSIEQRSDVSVHEPQSFVGPNPFSLTGDDSLIRSYVQMPTQPTNQLTGGMANIQSIFSGNTINIPTATTTSSFQYSTHPTSTNTSHSRAKRWTTS